MSISDQGGTPLGQKFKHWQPLSPKLPASLDDVEAIVLGNRAFQPVQDLTYGDHGLEAALTTIREAMAANKRLALYADYDVDGTMSCVSWIWFLRAAGYENFVHYIPCRFKEGYGLNLAAVAHLIDVEGADVIITMDTGITANAEAAYCRERGVTFICTDHHVIQPQKMPDCVILNPKLHPEADYRELCGCGITFVLLRRLATYFPVPASLWYDLLALAGMATICDVVPLNGVNHRLAKLGVQALAKSQRPVLRRLIAAGRSTDDLDEKDVGFRLGPRINAVGRLEHADAVIDAFVNENPDALITHMDACNERRKTIQRAIVADARRQAEREPAQAPILFLGGDWHPGVVGIAASKIAEEFWRPTWLFQRQGDVCKGSARSIRGFDVTAAMTAAADLFSKFGGHAAAAGFTFPVAREAEIRARLTAVGEAARQAAPELWESRIAVDCELPPKLTTLDLATRLSDLRPFGHGFDEPRFALEVTEFSTRYFHDRETGEPRHTCVAFHSDGGEPLKILFFNEVHRELEGAQSARFVVSAGRNTYRGRTSLALYGHDFELC